MKLHLKTVEIFLVSEKFGSDELERNSGSNERERTSGNSRGVQHTMARTFVACTRVQLSKHRHERNIRARHRVIPTRLSIIAIAGCVNIGPKGFTVIVFRARTHTHTYASSTLRSLRPMLYDSVLLFQSTCNVPRDRWIGVAVSEIPQTVPWDNSEHGVHLFSAPIGGIDARESRTDERR